MPDSQAYIEIAGLPPALFKPGTPLMARKTSDHVYLSLQIPRGLHKKLRFCCIDDRKTLQGLVVEILEAAVAGLSEHPLKLDR